MHRAVAEIGTSDEKVPGYGFYAYEVNGRDWKRELAGVDWRTELAGEKGEAVEMEGDVPDRMEIPAPVFLKKGVETEIPMSTTWEGRGEMPDRLSVSTLDSEDSRGTRLAALAGEGKVDDAPSASGSKDGGIVGPLEERSMLPWAGKAKMGAGESGCR
jgi:hypothetical protein